jgi:hypothetical protein
MASKRERELAGVATLLAALLESHSEPHPGADRDREVVEALAWYERAIKEPSDGKA